MRRKVGRGLRQGQEVQKRRESRTSWNRRNSRDEEKRRCHEFWEQAEPKTLDLDSQKERRCGCWALTPLRVSNC